MHSEEDRRNEVNKQDAMPHGQVGAPTTGYNQYDIHKNPTFHGAKSMLRLVLY